jgi:hypothetical protein
LAIGTGGDDTNISWVVNGCNDAGSKDNFLPVGEDLVYNNTTQADYKLNIPSLPNVDDINAVWSGLPEVRFHVNLHIL